jgi:tetratricopeptide (TPR) repeat protein/transcriptional regulator with XRE-family HTH domain
MSELPSVSFGSLLRSLRTAAGLTQEELAEAARVSYRSISDLERGVSRSPRRDTARLLADALDLAGDDRATFAAAARGRPPAPGNGNAVPRPLPGGIAAATRTLPSDIALFTGRESETESVLAAVSGAAASEAGVGGVVDICAIDGMAGIGKTALAVHIAHRLAPKFPDGQVFLQLHGHTPGQHPVDPADALASLLQASGIAAQHIPDGLEPRAWLWRDRLAGRRVLLVLDNAAGTGQVAPLLPGDGGCLVLVTSRRHLGDLPGAVTPVLLDVLGPARAAEMFTRLAPRAASRPAEVAEVVRLAGFLPLAISLLARLFARHPSWTLADLAAETRASLLTLTAEHDSVAAAFEVSYQHLDPAQQRLFRLLGLDPGTTIDGYAAAALAATGVREAAGLLDGLHREGLLTETGRRRYGMHDLLRRYARDHAAGLPGSEQALARLLDYYQRVGARADARLARQTRPGRSLAASAEMPAAPDLDDDGQALAWARAERANLLACLDYAGISGQHARVVSFTAALADLLRRDGPWADALARHAAAVDAAQRAGDPLGQANALNDLGNVRRLMGDYPGAAQAEEQALGVYRDLGDRRGEGNALNYLGEVWLDAGDYPRAAQAEVQALGIYRDLGDRRGQATALNDLGNVRRARGDYAHARQAQEQALGIYRDLGDRRGQASALNELGDVWEVMGDYAAAARALEQALAICRDLGDRRGQATALSYLGNVRRLMGDYPGAAQALEQALDGYRNFGDRRSQAQALNGRATLHRVSGDLASAEACHQQALELARAVASWWDEAQALAGLGRCALADGRATQAEELLRRALGIFQRLGSGEAPVVLAELDALTGPAPKTCC